MKLFLVWRCARYCHLLSTLFFPVAVNDEFGQLTVITTPRWFNCLLTCLLSGSKALKLIESPQYLLSKNIHNFIRSFKVTWTRWTCTFGSTYRRSSLLRHPLFKRTFFRVLAPSMSRLDTCNYYEILSKFFRFICIFIWVIFAGALFIFWKMSCWCFTG